MRRTLYWTGQFQTGIVLAPTEPMNSTLAASIGAVIDAASSSKRRRSRGAEGNGLMRSACLKEAPIYSRGSRFGPQGRRC